MDRLSILLTIMSGAVLTGAFVITAFSFGYYSWFAVLFCAAIGFLLSWPTAYVVSRFTKRSDPTWDHTKAQDTDRVPRPGSPEV